MAAQRCPRAHLLSIFALWLALYGSYTLIAPPLLDDADSVHAEVAREMLLRHDYVTLYANGIRYLEKAPLLYWSMAASFAVFGVSAAAARLPLALTVLALALTVEAFARRALRSAHAGLYAALILLSSPGVFLFTRILLPDALVCLWLTLALYAFWLTEQPELPGAQARRGLPLTCIFSACCALNVLTKGMIGIVFPAIIVGLYLVLTRGWRGSVARVLQLHPAIGTIVFLALSAPWHILIALANRTQGHPGDLSLQQGHWTIPLPTQANVHGWLWFYFVNEHLLRYLSLRVPRDYDTVPLWLFWGLCLVWLMPWSGFAFNVVPRFFPRHLAEWPRALRDPSLSPIRRASLLLALWAAVVFLFFLFSTRQEYYLLPAFPAIAILIAGWLAQDSRVAWRPVTLRAQQMRRANLRITAVLLGLGALFAGVVAASLVHTRAESGTDLSLILRKDPARYALSMGHVLDLRPEALAVFRLPLALAALSLCGSPFASYLLRKAARPHAATLVLAAGACAFLFAVHLGLQTFAPILTSEQLARAIAPQIQVNDLIVIHQEYEYGSTLGFYLQRPVYIEQDGKPVAIHPIHILEGRSANLWYGSFFPDAPSIFETAQSLAAKWSGPQRVFLWQDLGNQPGPLPSLPGAVYVIAQSGGKEVVSNQPSHPAH